MEVSYIEINECCRCCMNYTDELDNIFECFYKELQLHEILSLITGLNIGLDDGFPQSICDTCKDNAMRAYDFRETCIKSDTEIQELKDNEAKIDEITETQSIIEETQQEIIIEAVKDDEFLDLQKNYFQCPLCQEAFESSEQLAIHVANNHRADVEKVDVKQSTATTTGRKYDCKICGKKFESPWKLRRHFLVHKDILDPSVLPKFPPREYKHECQECGKKVETPSKLQRHMSVHDKKSRLNGVNQHRPFGCLECPQRFWDKVKLDRHSYIHSDDCENSKIEHPVGHMFTCVICLAQLPDYEECNEHMKAHREEYGENSEANCRLCNRNYPKLANVIRHSKLHAENATNQCTFCGKKFGFGDDFIDHVLRHKGFKPHSCTHPGCKKSFMKAHKLRLHESTHNQNSSKCFECDKCDKKFSEIEYLKKHLFRHLGIKSFECTLCPARFAVKAGLDSHMTTHTNERKFACGECPAKFTKIQTLKLHMKIHRNEKSYSCEYCNMKFVASGPLKRHLRIHTQEKPYKCEYCVKAYAQSNDLIKHLKVHLGPNVYSCTMCSQSFAKFKQLKDHQMEHYKRDSNLLKEIRRKEEIPEDDIEDDYNNENIEYM
ncbi:zinc finger protein ZFP2-like [Chironomus tepperi]|uniref:zinc finger protein ZFP2-like n=1 Tax=Chironomus tepperi TaxID=113505 RepID=UPI00391F45CE